MNLGDAELLLDVREHGAIIILAASIDNLNSTLRLFQCKVSVVAEKDGKFLFVVSPPSTFVGCFEHDDRCFIRLQTRQWTHRVVQGRMERRQHEAVQKRFVEKNDAVR